MAAANDKEFCVRLCREPKPIPGAVLIFERGSGVHVGFAVGQNDANFFVLGGNQSDAVTVEVAHSAVHLGMAQQQLHRLEVARLLVYLGHLVSLYQVRAKWPPFGDRVIL